MLLKRGGSEEDWEKKMFSGMNNWQANASRDFGQESGLGWGLRRKIFQQDPNPRCLAGSKGSVLQIPLYIVSQKPSFGAEYVVQAVISWIKPWARGPKVQGCFLLHRESEVSLDA